MNTIITNLQRLSYTLLFSLIAAASAEAQRIDPFLSETDGGGSYEDEVTTLKETADSETLDYKGARAEIPAMLKEMEVKRKQVSTVGGLLQAVGEEPQPARQWGIIEEPENDDHVNNYLNSDEVQVQEELARPLSRSQPFGDKLDYVEDTLRQYGPQDDKRGVDSSYGTVKDNFFDAPRY